jgi:hypothetical protein
MAGNCVQSIECSKVNVSVKYEAALVFFVLQKYNPPPPILLSFPTKIFSFPTLT